jgi:hypothetical protein
MEMIVLYEELRNIVEEVTVREIKYLIRRTLQLNKSTNMKIRFMIET